jgi:hypothetical protein
LDLTVPEFEHFLYLFFAHLLWNRTGQLDFTWSVTSLTLNKRSLAGSLPGAKLSQKCRLDVIASNLLRDMQSAVRGILNDLQV